MVATATSIKLSSSKASTRAVLNTWLLSLITMCRARSATASISATPCANNSGKRNTPQCVCMVFRIASPTSTTLSPKLFSRRFTRAKVASAALAGNGLCALFWAISATILSPAALPNTTKSNSEFEPKRLAPCTETHAASPTAYKPFTAFSPSKTT